MNDGQLLAKMGTDARAWATEFVRLHGGDADLMVGWFANAIEAGRHAGNQRSVANDPWEHSAPAPCLGDSTEGEPRG